MIHKLEFFKIGILIFSLINMRFFILFIVIFSNPFLVGQESNIIQLQQKAPMNLGIDAFNNESRYLSFIKSYTLYLDSVVTKIKISDQSPHPYVIGEYAYDFESENFASGDDISQTDQRYIVVKEIDQRIKFFNGSLLIKFNQIPNFEDFALENNVIFTKNLSAIKRGVFKLRDLKDIELVWNAIQSNPNVLSIELDLLDPSVQPN